MTAKKLILGGLSLILCLAQPNAYAGIGSDIVADVIVELGKEAASGIATWWNTPDLIVCRVGFGAGVSMQARYRDGNPGLKIMEYIRDDVTNYTSSFFPGVSTQVSEGGQPGDYWKWINVGFIANDSNPYSDTRHYMTIIKLRGDMTVFMTKTKVENNSERVVKAAPIYVAQDLDGLRAVFINKPGESCYEN